MLREVGPSAYDDVEDILPKLAQPHWYRLIGSPVNPPSAPTPAVARGMQADQKRRAKRSLAKRGVAGFLAAIRDAA